MKKGITLIAVLVGVIAVTSGAFAAKRYLITSSSQIKAGAVSLSDLSPAARKALHGVNGNSGTAGPQGPQGNAGPAGKDGKDGSGTAGPQGPKGDRGATGAQGQQGSAGVSGYEVRTWRYSKDDANSDMGPGYVGVGGGAIATVACCRTRWRLAAVTGDQSAGDNGFHSPALTGQSRRASFPWSHGLEHEYGQAEPAALAGSCRSTTRLNLADGDVWRHLRECN